MSAGMKERVDSHCRTRVSGRH